MKLEPALGAKKVCARKFGQPRWTQGFTGLREGLESLLDAVIGASGDPGTQVVGGFGVRRLVGAGEDLALGQQDRAGAYQLGERHPEQLGRAAHKLALGQWLKLRLFTPPEEVLGRGVVKEVLRFGLLDQGKDDLRVVGQAGVGFKMPEGFEGVFGQRKLVLDPAFGGAFLLSGHSAFRKRVL